MKKGISLIVLVITIIVMIIIAGAIIISLNSSNVIDSANEAVDKSNVANVKSALALEYAEIMNAKYNNDPADDNLATLSEAQKAYDEVLTESGLTGYTVSVDEDTLVPELVSDKASE